MRKKLDDIQPEPGSAFRVYFPGGVPPRVLVGTGNYDHEKKSHEMLDPKTGDREFVPGWLVAIRAKV